MENEENRGLINKNSFEDQWEKLTSSVLELSLSYSSIFNVLLEHSWRVWHTWFFLRTSQRKSRKV